jgi:hypothetical protein
MRCVTFDGIFVQVGVQQLLLQQPEGIRQTLQKLT